MSQRKTLQYAIYKGMSGKFGALQLNFQPAHYYKDTKEKDFTGEQALDQNGKLLESQGWKQREGAVFVEAAPSVGSNKYDWEQKITFALSVTDMGKIVHFLTTGKEVSIMHDPGAKTASQGAVKKYLNLSSPKGILEAGCMLQLNQQNGNDRISHTIPITPDECLVIRQLINTAIATSLNWN